MSLEKNCEELERKAWITSGSRFNASKRVARHANLATGAVVVVSIILVCLTVGSALIDRWNGPALKMFVNLMSVGCAVAVLALSLIDAAREYPRQAFQYHEAARRLRQVLDRARLAREANSLSQSLLEELWRDYHEALSEYNLNHDDVDFLRFELRHRITSNWMAARVRLDLFRLVILAEWPYWILAAGSISGFLYLLWAGIG